MADSSSAASAPLLDHVGRTGTPVVAVHGDCDLVVPLASARDTARRTGGELVVVHGATHSWLLQDPETLPAIVRELLGGRLGVARARAVAAAGLGPDAPLAAVDEAFAPAGSRLRLLGPPGPDPRPVPAPRPPHYTWTRTAPTEAPGPADARR